MAAWLLRVVCLMLSMVLLSGCTYASSDAPTVDPTRASVPTPSASRQQFATIRFGTVTADGALASTTVEDWVREADHVVVVRIAKEIPAPVSKSEIERREGLIGRVVSGEVESVVWSSPKPLRKAPDSIAYQEFGWVFHGTIDSKYRVGIPDRPYILPDHIYVIALRWFDWRFLGSRHPDGEGGPARFAPLGQYAIVPFDDDLGAGEFEGYRTENSGAGDRGRSFRKEMAGRSPEWLARALADASAANPPSPNRSARPTQCNGD